MARAPRPEDLYTLRVPTDVRISPTEAASRTSSRRRNAGKDDYRQSLWLAPFDGSTPRSAADPTAPTTTRAHAGALTAAPSRSSATGLRDAPRRCRRTDRADSPVERGKLPDDATQVWLLPMDGGEADAADAAAAERLRDRLEPGRSEGSASSRPRTSTQTVRTVGSPAIHRRATSHLIDRLQYMLNGVGYTYDKRPNLWVVEVAAARRGASPPVSSEDEQPAWSPDGTRICFVSNRHPDADLTWRTRPVPRVGRRRAR